MRHHPAEQEDGRLVEVLKALADHRRFRMLQEIGAAGELSCGQIGERFALSQPTISHHLKILQTAGLVTRRAEGQHHYVSLNEALVRRLDVLPDRLITTRRRPRRANGPRRARRSTSV